MGTTRMTSLSCNCIDKYRSLIYISNHNHIIFVPKIQIGQHREWMYSLVADKGYYVKAGAWFTIWSLAAGTHKAQISMSACSLCSQSRTLNTLWFQAHEKWMKWKTNLIGSNFGVVNNGALLRLAEQIFLQSKGWNAVLTKIRHLKILIW